MKVTSTVQRVADLRRRLAVSRVARTPEREGSIRVCLTMPVWTLYRSTDRDYIYSRFTRMGETHAITFLSPRSAIYTGLWNGEYLVRRGFDALGWHQNDQVLTPRLRISPKTDLVFSYGLYPRSRYRVPVIWEQTFAPQAGMDEGQWVERVRRASSLAVETAARVVTATSASGDWFRRIFPRQADKIRVVPYYLPDLNITDETRFAQKVADADGPISVLFVGKQARRKGLDTLVDAWRLLPVHVQRRFSVTVVSAMIDGAVALPATWRHLDYVADINALMADAHLLAFPTKAEAYGLVLVEALAAGCSVLTTHAPLQRSIVGEHAGYFVDPLDPKSVATALHEVASDRARIQASMRAARRRFADLYDPEIVGASYASLFSDVAGRSPASSSARLEAVGATQ